MIHNFCRPSNTCLIGRKRVINITIMQVILLKDSKLGRKYDVKEVSPGLARNILIPRHEAILATPANLKLAADKRRLREEGVAREEVLVEEVKNKLAGLTVEMAVSAGPEGQLFSKLHPEDIVKILTQKYQLQLDPKAISLAQPIKHVGLHKASARLLGGREISFAILVSAA